MVERGPGDGPKPHHTWHYPCGFGPSAGEARPTQPARPLSFPPPPADMLSYDGDWQMQELPGAPGTARQGRTGTSVPATRGGVATQPRAPGHGRPPAAPRAAGHGRLSAATGAPGADVPLATTARAPGQHCLSAVPRAPGHGRPLAALSAARHDRPCATHKAPGHDEPLASTAGAPGYDRLSAVAIATAPLPAGVNRPRQGVLPPASLPIPAS